ncbi:MAG TPA: hypothetical protein VM285_11400 [Polyangia bacterium]|nr:hypothetical protein [Polyangia bacterium]
MKILDATIEIRSRTTTEVIDLATLFYRAHWKLLLPLALLLGLPVAGACAGLHALTGRWWLALLAFILLSAVPSGAVVLAASRLVFGTPLHIGSTLRLYASTWAGLFFRRAGQTLLTLLLLPLGAGLALRLRWAFTPMIVLLERLGGRELARRRVGLNRRGGVGSLGLDIACWLVCALLLLAVVVVVDLVVTDLLGSWSDGGLFSVEALDDPLRFGTWMAAWLLVLPVGQLAWFFAYINARIRGEGWDLELGFRETAARLARDRGIAA